tara:strand:+ start:2565 stop:2777 length:213 start_codon:yes stop_codon:yes gene_type:complete
MFIDHPIQEAQHLTQRDKTSLLKYGWVSLTEAANAGERKTVKLFGKGVARRVKAALNSKGLKFEGISDVL